MQILRPLGGSRQGEDNMAAVQSALMDLLNRGGAFAGAHHVVHRNVHLSLPQHVLQPCLYIVLMTMLSWHGSGLVKRNSPIAMLICQRSMKRKRPQCGAGGADSIAVISSQHVHRPQGSH